MVEIERLIALELSQTNDSRPYQIVLVCEGDALRIIAYRDRSRQMLERSIEINDTHLKERIIALTVSQLVSTETEPLVKTKAPPSSPTASAMPQEEKEAVDHVAISLGGGVKPHDVFSLPTGYGLIRGDIWFSRRLGLIAILSFEGGRAKRSLGSVTALSSLAGLGGAWRVLSSTHLHLEISSSASIGYTHLAGNPHEDVRGGDLGGVAGEFVIGLGGVLVAKDVLVALELLVGYTVNNPVGSVDTDTSVTLAGFWLGGGLRIGFIKK